MEPLNFEQQKEIARKYRKMEPKIKSAVRSFSRKWKVPADDIEGAAREAFIKAMLDYKPDFGAQPETLIHTYMNTALNDESKRQKRGHTRNLCADSIPDFDLENHCRFDDKGFFEKDKARTIDSGLTKEELSFLHNLEKGITITEQVKSKKISRSSANKALLRIQKIVTEELL